MAQPVCGQIILAKIILAARFDRRRRLGFQGHGVSTVVCCGRSVTFDRFQRSEQLGFFVRRYRCAGSGRRRMRLVFGQRKQGVHHVRFRQGIAQFADARGQRFGVRQPRIRIFQRGNRLTHQARCFGECSCTGRIRCLLACAQALDVGLQRRQHMADDGNIHHRDRAVERVYRAQQGLAGRQRRRGAQFGKIAVDHVQMGGNFALQNLEQYRVDIR